MRRIIREPNVSPKERLRAIERLVYMEGLLDQNGHGATPKNKFGIMPVSEANAKRIRELIAMEQEKKTGWGYLTRKAPFLRALNRNTTFPAPDPIRL